MSVKKYSRKKDSTKKLSKNFVVSEFACKDGSDEILIDTKLVSFLQKIRDWAGNSVVITSAYRNPTYNKKIGGASNSYHTKGQAADIVVKGKKPIEVARYAQSINAKGIGCYNDDLFVHIDTRASKSYWYNQSCIPTSTFLETKYKTGNYSVNADVLNVRTGASTSYSCKKFSQLTSNAQKQILKLAGTKVNGYVKSMVCTVTQIKDNWGKTPSGWICLDYCRKI